MLASAAGVVWVAGAGCFALAGLGGSCEQGAELVAGLGLVAELGTARQRIRPAEVQRDREERIQERVQKTGGREGKTGV